MQLKLDRAAIETARRVRRAGGGDRDRARAGLAARSASRASGSLGTATHPHQTNLVAPHPRVVRPRGPALTTRSSSRAGARGRGVGACELVEAAIARIEAANPRAQLPRHRLLRARSRARSRADGPFAGVPMLVKDLTETAGVRTTFSSRAFADYVPPTDAAVVRRMKDAGFVVIGKSNTPEFGITCVTESELNGACRNPWDTSNARPAARRAARRRRSPRACCRSRTAPTAAARSASPRRAAASSGSSRRAAASPPRRTSAARSSCRRAARSRSPCATRRRSSTCVAGYEPGDAHWAPPPERPFLDEVRRRARAGCASRSRRSRRSPYPVDPRSSRGRARRRGRARGARPRRRRSDAAVGRRRRCSTLFAMLWQLTPALYPVQDESLLMPLNRCARRARARDVERRLRARRRARCSALARRVVAFWDDVDVVLTPGAREAAGADRLGLRAGRPVGAVRARRRVHAVHADRQRDRASRRRWCRSASSTGCPSACS